MTILVLVISVVVVATSFATFSREIKKAGKVSKDNAAIEKYERDANEFS